MVSTVHTHTCPHCLACFAPTCHGALVFAQISREPPYKGTIYIIGEINMHPFSWAGRAPLLNHSMVTPGACRRAVQDAKSNSCQSQVTVRLICGEPYFLCLPKDLAGQCALSLPPDKPHLPHTEPIRYVTSRLYKLQAVSCSFLFHSPPKPTRLTHIPSSAAAPSHLLVHTFHPVFKDPVFPPLRLAVGKDEKLRFQHSDI